MADVNHDHVYPIVHALVQTPYFRYFKTDLHCDCPLWAEDGLCAMPSCSVSECCEEDPVPEILLRSAPPLQCGNPHAVGVGVGVGVGGTRTPPTPPTPSNGRNVFSASGSTVSSDVGAATSDDTVDREVERDLEGTLGADAPLFWEGTINPWHADPPKEADVTYVNLLRNPERYTGYQGEHAHRIWNTLYTLVCSVSTPYRVSSPHSPYHQYHPHPADPRRGQSRPPPGPAGKNPTEICAGRENDTLYRLVSGMHASITTHVAGEYYYPRVPGRRPGPAPTAVLTSTTTSTSTSTSTEWGPNVELFLDRLGRPEHRRRLENLYFTYAFVLRAVMKAAPHMDRDLDVQTGFPEQDLVTRDLLRDLHAWTRESPTHLPTCVGVVFDETRDFTGESDAGREKKRRAMQATFRQITRVMDCVGCEKCKLWGKLQVLGMATALKINFGHGEGAMSSDPVLHYHQESLSSSSDDDDDNADDNADDSSSPSSSSPTDLSTRLDRNEMVALVNFLGRLSSSIETVRGFGSHVLEVEAQQAWHEVPTTSTFGPGAGDGYGYGYGPGSKDGKVGGLDSLLF